MSEAKQDTWWAVVELLGHLRLAGRLTEVEKFGIKMGQLDIPQKDGTFCTINFGGASVYRITHVSERVARDVAARCDTAPVSAWDYPKQLPSPERVRDVPGAGSYADELDDWDDTPECELADGSSSGAGIPCETYGAETDDDAE